MSRRFKNRHAKVKADPAAEPVPPVELDDTNSFIDPTQSDRRIPLQLNTRAYVRAGAALDAERAEATKRAIAEASRKSNGDGDSTG